VTAAAQHSPFCGCTVCAPPATVSRVSSPTVTKAAGDHAVEQIFEAVAEVYKLTVSDLKGRDRHRSVSEARNLAAWFAYKLTPLSYPEVGVSDIVWLGGP
jgi:chromosomal replication initiation ATPase DnaA